MFLTFISKEINLFLQYCAERTEEKFFKEFFDFEVMDYITSKFILDESLVKRLEIHARLLMARSEYWPSIGELIYEVLIDQLKYEPTRAYKIATYISNRITRNYGELFNQIIRRIREWNY